jgi:O-antigen ligase
MLENTQAALRQNSFLRWLNLIVGAAAVWVVIRLAMEEDLSWVGWVIASGAVMALAVTRWPYGAILVLAGASAMPRFFVQVFGWKARPEHFGVAIVSLACCVWLVRANRKIRLEGLDYWILAYLGLNYVASAFGSLSPHDTLRWALLNNLSVLPYFLIRVLVQDPETLRKACRILLAVGVLESAYGILCYLSNHVLGTATGMESAAYLGDVAAPYGSQYEPNLFGAYAGCCAVLALAVYLVGERRRGYLICFLISSLGTVVSLSRAALVALLVASTWVLWQSRGAKKPARRRKISVALAVGLILVMGVAAIGGVLRQRFNDLFNKGLAEETTITRLIDIQEALQDIPQHPLIGNGTASFQLSFDWGKYVPDWAGNPTWLGNLTVRILHDTGLLGLVTILGFLVSLWSKVRRGLRKRTSQVYLLVGLSAGVLLYGISFQATDGTLLAFPWIHLGLLASAAILSNDTAAHIERGLEGAS